MNISYWIWFPFNKQSQFWWFIIKLIKFENSNKQKVQFFLILLSCFHLIENMAKFEIS